MFNTAPKLLPTAKYSPLDDRQRILPNLRKIFGLLKSVSFKASGIKILNISASSIRRFVEIEKSDSISISYTCSSILSLRSCRYIG